MKKLRIALVSLLFICLAALMVVPALLPAPEAPVSADLMPTFDLADEGAAVLILEAAPTPVAAPAILVLPTAYANDGATTPAPVATHDFSMLLALGLILSPVSLMKRSASKLYLRVLRSNRDASVNDSTTAGPGFGGPLKFPL